MKPKSLIRKVHRPTPKFYPPPKPVILLAPLILLKCGSPLHVAPQRDFRGQRRPDCQE